MDAHTQLHILTHSKILTCNTWPWKVKIAQTSSTDAAYWSVNKTVRRYWIALFTDIAGLLVLCVHVHCDENQFVNVFVQKSGFLSLKLNAVRQRIQDMKNNKALEFYKQSVSFPDSKFIARLLSIMLPLSLVLAMAIKL